MIQQTDVDDLLNELTAVRAAMQRDRAAVADQIDRLTARAADLRRAAAGGNFEPAIASVHDLLLALHRGVVAQDRLNALR